MNTITLKSGATLELQEADFPVAWNLTEAILQELGRGLSSGLSIPTGAKVEDLMKIDIQPEKLVGLVISLLGSRSIHNLLWPCFLPCLYNGEKITKNTFSSPESRADFLPCVIELVKANVLPFFKGLDLSSLTSRAPATGTQK